ncbi:MAG: IPT/TIG domain-containing protein [Myxococcota bacterium]
MKHFQSTIMNAYKLIFLAGLTGCGFGFKSLTPDSGFDIDTELDGDDGDNTNDTSDTSGQGDGPVPDDTQDTDDTPPNDGDFTLASITPVYGSTQGGTPLDITGGPFDTSAVVYIGDQQAPMLSQSNTQLQVTIPYTEAEGVVDITVEQTSGSQTLEDTFSYFQDGTGKTSAIGNITFEEYIGGYWNPTGQTEFGSAMATFIIPTDFHWWEFYTDQMDSCAADSYTYSGSLSGYDMQSSMLSFSGNTSINLSWNTTNGWYDNGSLSRTDIFNNGYYTLDPVATGSIKGMTMTQFMRASSPSTLTQPAITASQIPTITRNQTLRWQPSGATWIMFFFIVRTADQMNDEQRVNCIVVDDGNFTLDGSVFSAWPVDRVVDIYFTRAFEQNTRTPHNNGFARVVGQHMLHGAAISQ